MQISFFQRQSSNIILHWYVLLDNFQFSTEEFYTDLEKELAARQTPGLKASRVEFYEGTVGLDKRVYLRLARERYAFDVCASPFGRMYFFSLRFVEKPRFGWLALLAIMALLAALFTGLYQIGNQALTVAGLLLFALIIFWIFRPQKNSATVSPGALSDFSSFLLNVPVIGAWYERVRRDTYFRYDTRLMYQTLITDLVKQKVEELSAAKGVKLIRTYEYNPILDELYKKATVKLNEDTTKT